MRAIEAMRSNTDVIETYFHGYIWKVNHRLIELTKEIAGEWVDLFEKNYGEIEGMQLTAQVFEFSTRRKVTHYLHIASKYVSVEFTVDKDKPTPEGSINFMRIWGRVFLSYEEAQEYAYKQGVYNELFDFSAFIMRLLREEFRFYLQCIEIVGK
jgi:hypothetical protein